jgi:ABC-type Fe3+-hydroxamate transport system substrate-binding protein
MSRRFLLLALLLAIACGESRKPAVTDGLGRSVVLPARVERVVTLAPNLTEIIFAVGAGEKIVGTDDYSNYPEAARRIAKVGGMQPNVERIAALKPDLVLASSEGNHPSLAPALAAAGVPLYVVRTDRLHEVAPAIAFIGEILDAPNTKEAVGELESNIAAQRRTRTRKLRVMFAVWVDPLYVGGRETFTNDLLTLTGAQNAVSVSGWPQYSLESLLASPPDLILYPRGAVTPQQIEALRKRVPELRAPIVPVDEDIFQRPGPRMVQAARALNAILDRTMNEDR